MPKTITFSSSSLVENSNPLTPASKSLTPSSAMQGRQVSSSPSATFGDTLSKVTQQNQKIEQPFQSPTTRTPLADRTNTFSIETPASKSTATLSASSSNSKNKTTSSFSTPASQSSASEDEEVSLLLSSTASPSINSENGGSSFLSTPTGSLIGNINNFRFDSPVRQPFSRSSSRFNTPDSNSRTPPASSARNGSPHQFQTLSRLPFTKACPSAPTRHSIGSKAASTLNCLTLQPPTSLQPHYQATLNSVQFILQSIGQGKEHHVLAAADSEISLTLVKDVDKGVPEALNFKACEYVVKQIKMSINNEFRGYEREETTAKADIVAHRYFQNIASDLQKCGYDAETKTGGIHLPKVLILPDPYSHKNAFFIEERLEAAVDCSQWSNLNKNKKFADLDAKSQIFLRAMKEEFAFSVRQGWLRIGDIKPDNFMWKKDREGKDQLYLADRKKADEDDELLELYGQIRDCAAGNSHIFEELCSGFKFDENGETTIIYQGIQEKNASIVPQASLLLTPLI